jgi:hypothetical protein
MAEDGEENASGSVEKSARRQPIKGLSPDKRIIRLVASVR